MKNLPGSKALLFMPLILCCSQVGTAATITYEGGLAPGVSVNGQVADGNIGDSATWDYWRFAARAGSVVTIAGHRQEAALDPAAGVFVGVYADSDEISGGVFSGIASADDNMDEPAGLSGPFSDPLIVFTAPADGIYTYALANFASGDPGLDGVFDYSVELSGGLSVSAFLLDAATPAATDALLFSHGREVNSMLSQHIMNTRNADKGFLSPSDNDGMLLWATHSFRSLDFENSPSFLGDADGMRNTFYVGADFLRNPKTMLGAAVGLGKEDADFEGFDVDLSDTTVGGVLYGAVALPSDMTLYATVGYAFVQNDFDYQLLTTRFSEEYDTGRFLASVGLNKTFRMADYRLSVDGGYMYSTESSELFSTSDGGRFETESARIGTARLSLDVARKVLVSTEVYGNVVLDTDITRSLADEDSGAQFGAGFRTELDPGVRFDLGAMARSGDVSEYGLQATLMLEL